MQRQREQSNVPDLWNQTKHNKESLKVSHLKLIMKRFNEIEQEHNHSVELIIEDALKRRTNR